MPAAKIKDYLDGEGIKYTTIRHSPAYTAQEIASRAHISGKDMAKTVIIKIDGVMAMAVLPASRKVDLNALRDHTGSDNIRLASEEEFSKKFPECETGAMPPFGNLYGMDVYVASSLTEDERIAFNAGTHSELIQMFYADFERLVKPKVVKFSAT